MEKKTISISVEEKLKALYDLQCVDSEIDQLRVVRGELPVEIQDLEDEIARLETRLEKIEEEKSILKADQKDKKVAIKNSEELIVRYKKQLENIKNNREFTSLTKELEFQELEIQLSDKRTNEIKAKVLMKDEVISSTTEDLNENKEDLEGKKSELAEITAETEKEEKALIKKSKSLQKKIDDRLLSSYERIRTRVRNGLALVSVDRDACGGCFNKIPAQRQLDIKLHKKVIVCEHCGRILVDSNILSQQE
ncbi:MAG: C4-type zinc ribbon domain-containing protein [Flavobacteriales bacterium]|nr:C4-type zinc ribbon domain-containing protein [Flavobacteriales bacterium]